MRASSTRAIAWVLWSALVLLPGAGRASGLAAYQLDETAWNGLSSLRLVVEHVGATIEERASLDLGTLDDEVVFIVHPTAPIVPDPVVDWVYRGGRLLVADDFGSAGPLSAAFGLERAVAPEHAEQLDANPSLPMLPPVGAHALSENIGRIVLNHPSALVGPGLPVFAFENGGGAVYDMSLGAGSAVLLSDPSLLTNLMLPIRGNERFVANALIRLCPTNSPCRVLLLTGEAEITGPLTGGASAGADAESVRRGIRDRLRELVERLRAAEVDPRALRVAAALLMVGTLLLLGTVFPSRMPAWLTAPLGLRAQKPLNEFEFNVRRFTGPSREPSFALPASLLKERFERLFYPALGLATPGANTPAAFFVRAAEAYVTRFEGGASSRRRRQVERLLASLAEVPARELLPVSRVPWMESKEVLRWYTEAREILDTMGLHDRFRADVRRPRTNS